MKITPSAFVIYGSIFLFWAMVFCAYSRSQESQNQATQTECAQFHPQTGEFEWINADK